MVFLLRANNEEVTLIFSYCILCHNSVISLTVHKNIPYAMHIQKPLVPNHRYKRYHFYIFRNISKHDSSRQGWNLPKRLTFCKNGQTKVHQNNFQRKQFTTISRCIHETHIYLCSIQKHQKLSYETMHQIKLYNNLGNCIKSLCHVTKIIINTGNYVNINLLTYFHPEKKSSQEKQNPMLFLELGNNFY